MFPIEIDRRGLVPQLYNMTNGRPLYLFYDSHIDIVRIDFIFDAGTALQCKFLQTASAIQLLTEGTSRHSARDIAEFMDFRGIVVEKNCDTVSATLTVYSLSRYLDELLPLLHECLTDATYPQAEFDVFAAKRRQHLQTMALKPSHIARCRFYESLYGKEHPLGRFATAEDIDNLNAEDVRYYSREYLIFSRMTILMGGNVKHEAVELVDRLFGAVPTAPYEPVVLPYPVDMPTGLLRVPMPNAVQGALRVGRLLPFEWSDPDYSRFMVLNTILGGYFGSRLMTNIREDKGYTYGIYSQTQIYRGSLAFYIVSDVAGDKVDDALKEIRNEVQRLCEEPVPEEELRLVKSTMAGDFLRGIDGVFERMERFAMMCNCGITERFTDNLLAMFNDDGVTSSELRDLAKKVLDWNGLLAVAAK